MDATQPRRGRLQRYFPILTRGAAYFHRTFDAFTAAGILSRRAGKDVMAGTA